MWSFFRLNNLNEHEFPNRPVNKVIFPKYYKNEFNIFVILGQIGLSGQHLNYLQFSLKHPIFENVFFYVFKEENKDKIKLSEHRKVALKN